MTFRLFEPIDWCDTHFSIGQTAEARKMKYWVVQVVKPPELPLTDIVTADR